MNINPIYYTLLEKPFFIDVRRIAARQVLIHQLLTHSADQQDGTPLSKRTPLSEAAMSVSAKGERKKGHWDDAPQGSVAVIPLKGDMMKQGTYCSYGTEELAALLMEAVQSANIIGTVLDVDSGGGAVDAIWPLTEAIGKSQAQGKPVVASCDLCASAAYYVSCHADRVMANNSLSAEFGSIGVMVQFADYQKYFEDMGIKVHTVYSDLSTYKNAPFEAALKGDYKGLKDELLNPLARQFQQSVREHRQQLDEKTEGLLQGRMFFARDAVRVGLADATGTLDDAVEEVRRLSADMQLRRLSNEE